MKSECENLLKALNGGRPSQASTKLMVSALESVDAHVFVTCTDFKLLYANASGKKLMGIAGEDLAQVDFTAWWREYISDAGLLDEILMDTSDGGWEGAVPMFFGNGCIRLLHVKTSPKRARNVPKSAYIWVITDITDRRTLKAEIAFRNEELSQRQRELEIITAMNTEVIQSMDLDERLRVLLRHASAALGCSNAAIFLPDSTWETLNTAAVLGSWSTDIDNLQIPMKGLSTWSAMLAQWQPMVIKESADNAWFGEQAWIREAGGTAILLPLRLQHRPLGALVLISESAHRELSAEEIRLGQALASEAALSIHHAMLFKASAEQAARLSFVNKIAAAVNGTLDIRDVCRAFFEYAGGVLPLDQVSIWIRDDDGEQFRLGGCYGKDASEPSVIEHGLSADRLISEIVKGRRWVSKTIDENSPDASGGRGDTKSLRSVAAVPLASKNGIEAVLVLKGSHSTGYTNHHRQLITEAAVHVTSAVRNARLFSRVKRAKQQWQKTFESISDGIAMLSPNKEIIIANPAIGDPKSAIGRKCYEVVRGLGSPCVDCPLEKSNCTDGPYETQYNIGDESYVESIHPVPNGDGRAEAYVFRVRNVTRERHVERYLSRSNRLAALGELAAGIAHNFGNVLMSVSATLELLHMASAKEKCLANLADTIVGAQAQVSRGAELIHRLLSMAKGTPSIITAVNPKVVAENAMALCATHPLAKRVKLVNDIPDNPILVRADIGQLEEVVVNLVLNAIQASEGGTISIGLRSSKKDNTAEICVSDEGCGIPPEEIGRIFDPFFSRRRNGAAGTGLGLSCCLAQVNRMGGTIEVQSEAGRGSLFKVKLPVWTEENETAQAA